jgi:hypothetical protein
MESRAGRGGRPSLESRLAANYRDANNKTLYSEGYDDRHHQLHPARFAPGVLCKIPDVWKLAKEFVPARGPDPVAQYDTKSVGIGHRVTAKAWTVTHDQGNTEINIGLFTAAASIAPGSDSGRHCAPPEDLDDLKNAVSLARAALWLAAPWNPALMILQIFLERIKYGYRSFSNSKDHVSQVTNFINQVLVENARSWQLGQPCMTADDLASSWVTFTAGRASHNPAAVVAAGPAPVSENKTDAKTVKDGAKNSQKEERWETLKDGALCGRYNEGHCRNRHDNCMARGFKLRHLCSHRRSNGERCRERHPAFNHYKYCN